MRAAVVGAGALAAAQWVPSVVSLGRWSPARGVAGVCRWRGRGDRPVVAVTVDDGPDPTATPAMLDALERAGMVATFFCLGEQADAHPRLVAEITGRGHAVGVHGHRHTHHLLRGPLHPGADLDRAVTSLRRAVGDVALRWYRPPYGQATGATLVAARRRGLQTVLWSAWGREWADTDPVSVAARLRRDLAPGAVVLLHDSDRLSPPGTAERAVTAVGALAVDLRRAGLRTATLDEVLR